MKKTIEENIITLIKNTEKEIVIINKDKEVTVKYEDYSRALICRTSIFHKTKFVEQLKKLL